MLYKLGSDLTARFERLHLGAKRARLGVAVSRFQGEGLVIRARLLNDN
jgi:hypothetical protein